MHSITFILAFNSCAPAMGSVTLTQTSSLMVPGGAEISSFDPTANTLYTIGPLGIFVTRIDEHGALSFVTQLSEQLPGSWEPTSIAVDPRGRGFMAVSWIPSPGDLLPGLVQILDTESGETVTTFPAGYHPDCIAFTPDGSSLLIANECEPGISDRPGALTVIDLRGVTDAADLRTTPPSQTFDFSESNRSPGVTLDGLRITSTLVGTPEIDIEPEYLAPTNDGVWVSLQENNALAYFDLRLREWSQISPLQPISMPFDGSDTDGITITTHAGFLMMPQPDTINSIRISGHEYLVLANEGESGDLDMIPLSEALAAGIIDPALVDTLHASYSDHQLDNLMNLRISVIDGDLDHDGDLDRLMIAGARGFAIHDAQDGTQIWNSGSQFERITGLRFPDRYNNGDSRSDQSGPEPEGIALGKLGDRTLAFVGLERTDAVMMYDISNPSSPIFLDAVPLNASCGRPEGLSYFTIGQNHFLSISSEAGGCISIYRVQDTATTTADLTE